jgi:outer membrane protein TolC
MKSAAEVSPHVQAARLRSVAAQHRIGVAQSGFLPDVSITAADTTGFPGSTGTLGTSGLVASPFRSGAAAGIVANVPIWDFGRTSNAVDAAKHSARSEEASADYSRYQVYETAVHLYYRCSLYRTLRDVWRDLATSARLVRDEVSRFVRTGQRSIVERYLAESQAEDATTQFSVTGRQYEELIKELALLTGMPAADLACPPLPSEEDAAKMFHGEPTGNPVIAQATEALAAAKARVSEARADFLPKLVGVADAGVMQNVRFVQREYYALGVAIILPVFQGFKTSSEVDEAAAVASSKEKELEARKLEIADLNAEYDRTILSARVGLTHMREEMTLAEKGFQTAKTRYLSLQGSVVDVREALRNLARVQVELSQTLASYLEASGGKAVLNGTPF